MCEIVMSYAGKRRIRVAEERDGKCWPFLRLAIRYISGCDDVVSLAVDDIVL